MDEQELAELEALLAQTTNGNAQLANDLEAQLAGRVATRDAEQANILQQLQGNFAAQQGAVADLAPATSGFQNFVDAATGSNFSRSAEALANQRALIAGGQDPVSKAFAQQFAQEAEIQQADNITPGQQLNAEVQINNQRRADAKANLQAELDIAKANRQAEKDRLDRELKDRQEARADRAANARIRQGDRRNQIADFRAKNPSTKPGATSIGTSGFDPSTERSFIGKASGFAVQRNNRLGLKSSSASVQKETQGVVDNLAKVKAKVTTNTERARNALNFLKDAKSAATNIAQIQTLILKAGGEVGGLTDNERESVNGLDKSFFSRAKATIRREGSGTISEEQLNELRRVANIFLINGERVLKDSAVAAKNRFKDLGLTEDQIFGSADSEGLPSLSGIEPRFFGFAPKENPVAPVTTAAPAVQATVTPDPAAEEDFGALLEGVGL